jgi:AraC family transcriptional regulator
MQPRIETMLEKKLIGQRMRMSFTDNKTFDLWRSFMPRRNEIQHTIGTALYSLEVYPQKYFDTFDPKNEFDKWAAVEVTDHSHMPPNMEPLTVPEGLYAIFLHKGPASDGPKTYNYIFQTWLPYSEYELDNRPHMAVMRGRYKKDSPESEEDICVPIKPKNQ